LPTGIILILYQRVRASFFLGLNGAGKGGKSKKLKKGIIG
jgi:hypothetical protein